MHSCYCTPADWNEINPCLSPEELHHLVTVSRARDGEEVRVFDGQGRALLALVRFGGAGGRDTRHLARELRLEVVRSFPLQPRPVTATLIQAIPKGDRMDTIVEKLTELGVAEICPVITDRVIKRPESGKVDRWRKIALSAAKQSGSSWLPVIRDIALLDRILTDCKAMELLLVGSLQAASRPVHDVFVEVKGKSASISRVGFLVGPEGDFTADEMRRIVASGAREVSFGSTVLRTDTAAIYFGSLIRYELM